MRDHPPELQRVVRISVADAAYESVRNAIVSGAFAPGEQLVEARVAELTGVSRGTARDALRRVRDEGLVIGSPHRGVFVRELTPTDLVDIYNLRVGIEGVAVRLCTRARASTEPLMRCVEEMRARVNAGDVPGLGDRETAFHEELCVLSGNAYLTTAFRTVAGLVRLAFAAEYAGYPDPAIVPDEHLPIVEAIAAGDEEKAVRAVVDHIDIAASLDLLRSAGDPRIAGRPGELVSRAGVVSSPAARPQADG